jgi:PAS domain S-box-containing protein
VNRTLLRQLKRAFGVADESAAGAWLGQIADAAATPGLAPEVSRLLQALPGLITRVDASYDQSDRDLNLRSRSLELSSAELSQTNERLRRDIASRHSAVRALRHSIDELLGGASPEGAGNEEGRDDFESVAHLVAELVSASAVERNQLDNLKFALDQHAIVSITDVLGNITYANDRMCAASGYRRAEIIGSNHRMFKSGAHPDAFYEGLWATISRGEVWNGEICNRNRNGDLVWFNSSIVPMLDENGLPASFISICTDISERKRAEGELERARDQAQAANVAKSRFLATMSHELRTPLHGILGMAQLLSLPGTAEHEREMFVSTILSSGHLLLAQLNELLDFSKIEAGRMNVTLCDFSPGDVVAEMSRLFAGTASVKGILLLTEWEDCGPGSWRSDPQRLRQIVANLVSNAIKFTEKGGVTVRGRIEAGEGDAATLHVSVTDTGIGIAPGDQERLFQPFQQLDDSNTRRYGGTGLGLSIVRNLAQLLHGTVDCESEPGRGSTFHVRIPVRRAAEAVTP